MSENISIEEILRRANAKKNGKVPDDKTDDVKIRASDQSGRNSSKTSGAGDKTKAVNINDITSSDQHTMVLPKDGINNKSSADGNQKTKAMPQVNQIEKTQHIGNSNPIKNDRIAVEPDINKGHTVAVDINSSKANGGTAGARQKSFFRREYTDEPVYTKEPPEIIEKPATIKSKSKFNKVSDLQEIPTILAVEELERTRVMGAMDSHSESEDDSSAVSDEFTQIKMSGFDDEIEKVSRIEEEEAEAILRERRKDKINKFRLLSNADVTDEKYSNKFVKSDFRNQDEKTAVTERLFSQKSVVQTSIIFTAVFGALLLLLTVFRDTKYLPSFLLSNNAYFITALILFALIMVSNINNIIHGFNFSRGINHDFIISVSAVAAIAHTILVLADADMLIDSTGIFESVVTLGFFLSSVGKRSMLIRIIENFEFITDGKDKYTVETIENTVDATIISRGFLYDEPNIKTSILTDFPANFLEIGCANEPADKITAKIGIAMLVLNAALFGVIMYVTKNWQIAFNSAVCGLCISSPVAAVYATNQAILGVSRSLIKRHCVVNGFAGAQMVDDANAMIIEAHDLFGVNNCDLHGIKTFNGAKIDDAILQTAAVIIKTKSPLAHVFDDVIVGKQSILPEVDDIVYEDKMGTSGWIYKKKILVGNRDLLINHGISVPKEEFENKYTKNSGRKALYLAVAGKITAMFIVSYSADNELKKALKKLERSGIMLLVSSCDPYINENSLNELFSLPEGFIRVINASSGRAYEKYSNMHAEKSPAYVVHDGSALGFIGAMRAAQSLIETKGILSILVAFGSAIGFGVVTLMSLIGGYSQLSPVNVLIFQGVWTLFLMLVTKLRHFDI